MGNPGCLMGILMIDDCSKIHYVPKSNQGSCSLLTWFSLIIVEQKHPHWGATLTKNIQNTHPSWQPRIFVSADMSKQLCHLVEDLLGNQKTSPMFKLQVEPHNVKKTSETVESITKLLYHLESRWRNSHVLVYHGPLPIHLLGVTGHLLSLRSRFYFSKVSMFEEVLTQRFASHIYSSTWNFTPKTNKNRWNSACRRTVPVLPHKAKSGVKTTACAAGYPYSRDTSGTNLMIKLDFWIEN